jgi:hypothetical protein
LQAAPGRGICATDDQGKVTCDNAPLRRRTVFRSLKKQAWNDSFGNILLLSLGLRTEKLVYCYECYEELIHNPVLLPEDITLFQNLVRARGLTEADKPESREKIAGRIKLFHEVIACGLRQLAGNRNEG